MPIHDDDYALHREIIEALLSSDHSLDRRVVNRIKNRICGKYRCARVPSNPDILQAAIPEEIEVLRQFLQKRPVRTVSGVAVVATMTEPYACPHGKCAYCPGGPEAGVPQSYTGHEPATMRGLQHEFDPYLQTEGRLNQLRTIGHSIEKVELIVMGGDWCSKPSEYREFFVKGCLDAMNGIPSKNLSEAKALNASSEVRNVGMTFETRPDWVTEANLDDMLEMGATRVEIGVQTLSDDVLELVERGHDVEATIQATKLLRDSGLKVAYHMMPGLPTSSPEDDLVIFETLFKDSHFCPDMLKIYPTIVTKNTKLHEWWINGDYIPYATEQTVSLIAKAVSKMPEYVRIQRMQRDIPLHQIEAGLDVGNLRELVNQRMKSLNLRNPTIRFREIGHFQMRNDEQIDFDSIRLVRRDYDASEGVESFLSFEEPDFDVIFAFLRLRKPSEDAHRPEVKDRNCVMIRELRVYGPVVNIGERDPNAWQHQGLGEKLIAVAEQIGQDEFEADRILVNSGIGVKPYYHALGFTDTGPYLSKSLQKKQT